MSSLVTVRGAELVDGRIVFGDQVQPGARVGVWSRAWRYVSRPAPLQLVPGERFIMATRRHWCVPLKEVSGMGVMWPAVFLMSTALDMLAAGVWFLKALIWLGAGVHQVMVCHRFVAWRSDLLVVTDKRLVQTSGVFSNSVKEVILSRVTNFEMYQSFWGQLFRFGRFRIEAAGVHDDGAQRELIKFVPDPGAVFQAAHVWMTRVEDQW